MISKKTKLLNLLRKTSGTQYELARMLGGNWNHHAVRCFISVLRSENYNIVNEVIPNSRQTRYNLIEEKTVTVNNKMKRTLVHMPRGSGVVFVPTSK